MFKFALKTNWNFLFLLFPIAFAALLYIFGFKDKEYFKGKFFSFIGKIPDLDLFVKQFWDKNEKNIKSFYVKQHKDSDYIVSASPDFLLEEIARRMDFNLIATKIDKKTGQLIGKNCYGKTKVARFKKTGLIVDCFYSDSFADAPMSKIAKHAFIVKGEKIVPWSEYKVSLLQKLKKMFLNKNFIIFVFIGAINAFNGIWLALAYPLAYHSFISTEVLSYSMGFLTSVIIAYILNSLFNFHKKLSLLDCIKYVVGNIPNYIIQIVTVFVLVDLLKWERIIVYMLAALISVPITFCIVKIGVYNRKGQQ